MKIIANQHDPELKTLCLYHNDSDGRASAAIIRRALGPQIDLFEMNYGDTLPLEKIFVSDHIIIVDFSLPLDEMKNLTKYHKITWIDHHKTAMDEMSDLAGKLPGMRDTSEAACVLTWRYFYPNEPVPKAVRLIGDRDIWRWAEDDTGPFNEGLYQLDTRPYNDKLWIPLLNNDKDFITQIIQDGKILRDARLRNIRRTILSRGYPVSFNGYKTLVVNIRGSGDIGQQARDLGYQIAYCYVDNLSNGELTTYVSLYSAEVDVSEIAQKFGGGGHFGAAGFHFKRSHSPFPSGAEIIFD